MANVMYTWVAIELVYHLLVKNRSKTFGGRLAWRMRFRSSSILDAQQYRKWHYVCVCVCVQIKPSQTKPSQTNDTRSGGLNKDLKSSTE